MREGYGGDAEYFAHHELERFDGRYHQLEHLVALLLDDSLHDHGAVHEYEHVYEQAEDVGGCHVQCAGGVPRLSGVGNLLGLELDGSLYLREYLVQIVYIVCFQLRVFHYLAYLSRYGLLNHQCGGFVREELGGFWVAHDVMSYDQNAEGPFRCLFLHLFEGAVRHPVADGTFVHEMRRHHAAVVYHDYLPLLVAFARHQPGHEYDDAHKAERHQYGGDDEAFLAYAFVELPACYQSDFSHCPSSFRFKAGLRRP